MRAFIATMLLCVWVHAAEAQNKSREDKVREDRTKVEAAGFWIYNDLPRAKSEAIRSGKPLLVTLRCIPCEECVKLDDDLVDQDPVIRPLLEQFVCVRIVSTNGLDLSLFQYDTDQSFAVFMLHPEGTIYGRFGTRSHRTEWLGDVSLPGLVRAMEKALELHSRYPEVKASLAGKRGSAPEFASPELYPLLKDKYTDSLDNSGNVVKSCIHCHQIGEAQREYYWSKAEPIPASLLDPYPHPKSLGLVLDPRERATVLSIENDSLAARAGFRPGDRIEVLQQQPMLSMADIQTVLHQVSASGGTVTAEVIRAGMPIKLSLELPDGWRRTGNLSWCATTWSLRRIALGGMLLESIASSETGTANPESGELALRVKHVGQFGAHQAAKNAGFQKDDIVTSFDQRTDFKSESEVLRHVLTAHKRGDKLLVKIMRAGKPLELTLTVQP